jgi:DNA polymerase I
MVKKLFLLDGMALVYRAHFALAGRPVFTSTGVNSSALFGFTQTLLDILANQQPTHLAVAFDTETPTERHREYPQYKAHREAMPEDIIAALPHVRRLIEAMNIPVLICEGFEADDIIGTLVRRAERQEFQCHMVTPDKDFGQLVTPNVLLYKPGRLADQKDILGPAEICQKWGIDRPDQVPDILGLWGDASDNIPGVPGIGEKTASKLIAQYGSLENLLAHTADLKGRQRQNLEQHRDNALLSKRLATINCAVPIDVDLDALKLRPPNEPALKQILAEFEFNSIGRRLFGSEFQPDRAPTPTADSARPSPRSELSTATDAPNPEPAPGENGGTQPSSPDDQSTAPVAFKCLADIQPQYTLADQPESRRRLLDALHAAPAVGIAARTDGADARTCGLSGLAFSTAPGVGWYLPIPPDPDAAAPIWAELRSWFEADQVEKIAFDVKFMLGLLRERGLTLRGRLFDVLLAHTLIEPDLRHTPGYMAESLLGYRPSGADLTTGSQEELDWGDAQVAPVAEETIEMADLAGQLRAVLEPRLNERGQMRVFHEIEMPLVPVLVAMEAEGIRIEAAALAEFAQILRARMAEQETAIHRLAGTEFNLQSPRQLGEILFERLKLVPQPKRTRTGQHATDEATLAALAPEHEIVRRLLDHRACGKLKSTYADTLPATISPRTGRVHTTYQQLATATGRLNSLQPNLQNIPIRTELGQEIRKAFVPRDDQHLLLSADYSQIELRIIASLARETALIEAFQSGADVHTATAARVFGVAPDAVTDGMRSRAKMVNYGIAYGISAFGLAQRLAIPRKEAASIIDHYFAQFPGIRDYMTRTTEFAREQGYVETITGRRRYLRDIRSRNATVRAAAERNAINAPVQGTAADMIKIAMIRIHDAFERRAFRSRMLLQVHDELVFDLHREERDVVPALVQETMRTAIPLEVPIVVEVGIGRTWLEAH